MSLVLKSAAFRAEREASWRELERLVEAAERKGIRALPAADLLRLPALYRGALSALSVARAISLDRNVVAYLDSLAARAYLVVYGTRRHLRDAIAAFFGRQFPSAVRRHRWHLAAAFALLAAGTAAGFALTIGDADRFYGFVDAMYAQGRGPTSSTGSLRDALYTPPAAAVFLKTFSMFLFSNNAKIGLSAFVLGFAGGVPTALLLFANGLVLGAFAALYHGRGLSFEFWAWLLPHGVTELTAVALCGAAGLALAQALVFPGQQERRAALASRGRAAGVMALGAVALFLVAGIIEGMFRQRVHSVPWRYGVAAITAAGWTAYFAIAGRGRA